MYIYVYMMYMYYICIYRYIYVYMYIYIYVYIYIYIYIYIYKLIKEKHYKLANFLATAFDIAFFDSHIIKISAFLHSNSLTRV